MILHLLLAPFPTNRDKAKKDYVKPFEHLKLTFSLF